MVVLWWHCGDTVVIVVQLFSLSCYCGITVVIVAARVLRWRLGCYCGHCGRCGATVVIVMPLYCDGTVVVPWSFGGIVVYRGGDMVLLWSLWSSCGDTAVIVGPLWSYCGGTVVALGDTVVIVGQLWSSSCYCGILWQLEWPRVRRWR